MKLVVSELDQIQSLLQQLAAGDASVRSSLLSMLSAHIVVIPMTEVRTTGERGETKRIKLVTLTDGERKTIPVFTSEDLFFAWSNDRYQCLPIAVEDLALTLAAGTDIAVDLNTPHESRFNVAEFTSLQSGWNEAPVEPQAEPAKSESQNYRNQAAVENAQEKLASTAGGNETDSSYSGQSLEETVPRAVPPAEPPPLFAVGTEVTEGGLNAETVASVTSSGDDSSDAPLGLAPGLTAAEALSSPMVIDELRNLLREFPDITEAYFTTSGGEHGRGILGVLAEHSDSEKRFNLISTVADLSRNLLGYAGAIDVYDDLQDRQSGSWNLFVALTPFYIRADGRSDFHGPEGGANPDSFKKLPGDHRLVLLTNPAASQDEAPRKRKGWLGGFKLVSRR